MTYQLGYYGAKLIAGFEFPHGIQTRPERDALGIPTIMGMTSLPDGTVVSMDMEFSEADIVALYGERKKEFVDAVNKALRVPVNQFQFDALVGMAFNIGVRAFSDEANNSVLRLTNRGEFENAAAAFGKWMYGTLRGGTKGPDGKPAQGPDGEILQPGQVWKRAFRGLYRRNIAQALLYSGLDWERAAHADKIQLTKRTEPRPFGFYDVVKFRTPWKKIKEDAKYDVLEDPETFLFEPDPVEEPDPIIDEPVIKESLPELPPVKQPPKPFRDYDPAAEPKDIALSKRVWGLFMVVVGWFTMGMEAIASLPIVSELAKMSPLQVKDWRFAMLILMAGFLLYWIGQVKAKSPLK